METSFSPVKDTSASSDPPSIGLSAAKQLRKKAEDDATVLANRIALLKEEEAKALKKIDDTRRRAREIMDKRLKAETERRLKEEERKAKDEEMRIRSEHLRLIKEERKTAAFTARETVMQKLRAQVLSVRESKAQNQELIEKGNNEVMLEKARITQRRKDEEHEARRRREMEEYEKQARFKAELAQKTQSELARKQELEDQIRRMEAEELELINKLQNTQLMQKTALQELEEAASRPLLDSVDQQ